MKKILISCFVVATVAVTHAQEKAPAASAPSAPAASVAAPAKKKPPFDFKKPPANEAERLARLAYVQERRLRHTGGMVIRPGTQAGEIVYVNCQKRAAKAWLEESAAYFRDNAKFAISVKDGSFDFANPKIEGTLSLFIIDDEKMPSLLIAPENRWAIVNVAPLAKGRGEAEAFFAARVKKELTRGFSALCGATNSQYPQALTGGIASVDQLDKHSDARLPVDVIARFAPYLEPFGVTPAIEVTYRRACQEGWAPAPTNDYQKAIFEQTKKEKAETVKGPEKPRKIVFVAKKGE